MDHKTKNGIWIGLGEGDNHGENAWLNMVLVFFSGILTLLTTGELTGFNTLYNPWVMILLVGIFSIIFGVMEKRNLSRWLYPGILFLLLLIIVFGGKIMLDGFGLFWNHMGNAWTLGNGMVLPELMVSDDATKSNGNLLLFAIVLGCIVALICMVFVKFNKKVLAILLPVLMFIGMFLFKRDYSFPYMIPVLLFSICLFLSGIKSGGEKKIPAVVGRVIPVLICCVLLVLPAMSPGFKEKAIDVKENIHEFLHTFFYETKYTTLPEGDFSDYKNTGDGKQSALVVSMDKPEEMYLRGFTGAVFENDKWSGLSKDILAENRDNLYWLNKNGWNPNALFEDALSLMADRENILVKKNTVTIQNLNACSNFWYVPYNLCEDEYLVDENINLDSVESGGERTYIYSVVLAEGTDINGVIQNLQKADDENTIEYLQAENVYREFAYKYYRDIPKDVLDEMKPYWDELKEGYENSELTLKQAQECVVTFMAEYFDEEGEPKDIPLPLDVAKGSDFCYATVMSLTLRYFGIPSRYVEGYVITKDMAKKCEEGGSITLDSSCAGAWVEVYQDGIGWIPVNLTPGMEKQPINEEKVDNESPIEEPKPLGEPKEEEKNDEHEETQKEPEGGYVVGVPPIMSQTVWGGVLIVILLLLLILIRRKLLINKRRKRWREESSKDAVAWIFADSIGLLERAGFKRGNGSVTKLLPSIKERYGAKYAWELKSMISINAKAMFFSGMMEEKYRELAKAFYADTLQHLKKSAKWYEKMWMQWFVCLY